MVGQAALRLVAAVGFALLLGAVGVLVGVAVGNVLAYLFALGMVGRPLRPAAQLRESRDAFRSLAVILPSSVALAVLFGADVLLVKHFFNGGDAGRYAAVAALGRAIFWGASGITIVLFPKAALRASQGSSGVHLVLGSVGICLLGGLAGLAILSLGARVILTMFAGPAYVAASAYLPWYAIAMTLFGGASVLVANGQARGKTDFLAVLIPVTLLEPVLITAFHQTLSEVVLVLSISMAVLFVGLAALYIIQERTRVRPELVLEGATA
jgi:O-antigen/teichoic acid export membrane protein